MKTISMLSSAARGCCFAGLAIVFAVLLFVSGAVAQSTTDGAIAGSVADQSGAAIPNAKVTVMNLGTGAEFLVMTDDTGYFRVGKLQPASYSVSVEAAGFAPFKVERVIVQVGSITDVPAKLNVASAGATVVVSAEIPQINTNSAEFAPTLDQTAINNLPINGGRWSNFVLLTPGAVANASGFGLISFRGMSTLLNNNTVDGGDNNQAFFFRRTRSHTHRLLQRKGRCARVSGKHLQLFRGIRPRCRRCRQHGHQERLQPVPWRSLFLRPRQFLGCFQSFHHAHQANFSRRLHVFAL